MVKTGRIGMYTKEGIVSVSITRNACICNSGYYLSHIYNSVDKVAALIEGGDIIEFRSIDGEVIYENEKDNIPEISTATPSNTALDEYIKLCERDSVDYGYLFTEDEKWMIVAGFCVGELQKKSKD